MVFPLSALAPNNKLQHQQTALMSETNPELREADRQRSQLVVVQVQMLKAGQVPQIIWQTVELVFTQVHLHQVGQVAELWLYERHPAIEK